MEAEISRVNKSRLTLLDTHGAARNLGHSTSQMDYVNAASYADALQSALSAVNHYFTHGRDVTVLHLQSPGSRIVVYNTYNQSGKMTIFAQVY